MNALWPCSKCGDPNGPTLVARAQGRNTYLVACRKCLHKGKESVQRAAAIAQWNEEAEREAQAVERRARRAIQAQASALRKDEVFIAAVLEHYVGRMQFIENGPWYQAFRLEVDGAMRAVNTPVFVDRWLVERWPELKAHKNPDRLVYHVLYDAGKGTRDHYVQTGEFVGQHTGDHRTQQVIGPILT